MNKNTFINYLKEKHEIEFIFDGEMYLVGGYSVRKNHWLKKFFDEEYCIYPEAGSEQLTQKFSSIEEVLEAKIGTEKLKDILNFIEIIEIF